MDDSVVVSEGALVNRRQQRLHTLQHRPSGGPDSYKAALIFHHGEFLATPAVSCASC